MAITSKKTRSGFIAIIFFVLLISIQATAQNEVAIGSNTTKSNAILWLNGNGSQGLILPVVTNKSAVSNPDKGMVVFDDSDDKVYYHSGAAWVEVGGGGGASSNPSLLLEGNQLQLKDGTTVKSTVNLAAGTQSNGAFLVFTGGSWQYATLSGDVTGANGALQVDGVKGKTIPTLPTTTQALVYDGTAWKFQALTAGTDSQTLTFTSPNLSISNGNSVNLSTLDKDAQTLSLTGNSLSISGGNSVNLPASGTVTSITAGAGLTGGTITNSGTINVDVGTTANKIVQLDATGKLPVIDGSQLTNLPVQVEVGDISAVTAGTGLTGGAITGAATLNVDVGTTANKIVQLDGTGKLPAVDGSQLTNLAGDISAVTAGTGLTGGATTGAATLNVDVGTTANKIVQLDGTGKLPAVDGSQLTNLAGGGDITGVTVGTGLTGGGLSGSVTIAVDAGTTANKIVQLDGTGRLPAVDGSQLTNLAGDITAVTAGTGLTGGATTGAATLNVDVGTTANKVVQLDGTGRLPAVDGSQVINLNASNITSGTLPLNRLTTGSGGTILTMVSGVPTWSSPAASFTNPMTTAGDIIYGGLSGAPTRLAGTTGILKSNGTTPTWGTVNLAGADVTGILPVTNGGTGRSTWSGLLLGSGSTISDITTGTAGQVLKVVGTTPSWQLLTDANIDPAAAINGSKIIPNFGTQALTSGTSTTFGTLSYTWPGTAGAANSVLTNNGAGVLTWASSSGWGLTGNDISASPTSFIGTTGNNDLTFKRNNSEVATFDVNNWLSLYNTNGGGPRLNLDATKYGTGGRSYLLGSTTSPDATGGGLFIIEDKTAGAYRFAINSVGNVGIGTTTPISKLDVDGDLRLSQITAPTNLTDKLYNVGGNLFWNGTNLSSGSGWGLTGNSSTVDGTNFIGTTDNIPFTIRVNNEQAMRISFTSATSAPNILAGYSGNTITNGVVGSAILSGGSDVQINQVSDNYSVIGGGSLNQAGNNNADLGDASAATVSGGNLNKATSSFATVGGGYNNEASGNSAVVAGGRNAIASGEAAGVLSGEVNKATGFRSAVVGGNASTASGSNSFVGGGEFNGASGNFSAVSGGGSNLASGPMTSIPGGQGLFARSYGETAVGIFNIDYTPVNATAFDANDRLFVIGNGTGFSSRSNALTVLKSGNVGIGTTSPDAKLDIAGTIKITDGSQGAGKVLTSDANGLASWQTAGSSTGWTLAGNTVSASDYIGTNNNLPFNIKVNNVVSGTINPTSNNTFFGYGGGKSNPTGTKNSGFGDSALDSNTTGNNNAGFGFNTLTNNLAGSDNTAFGYQSMNLNTNAGSNTAIGRSALFSLAFANGTTAYDTWNTGVGYQALYNTNPTLTTNGILNTALGYDAGNANTTGDKNTFIGANAGPVTGTLSNANAIGYNAKVSTSNSLVLGGTGSDAVKVGVGTTAPNYLLQLNDVANVQAGLQLTAGTATGTTATDGLIITSNASAANILNRDATNLNLGTSAATRLTISSTGNIGLGNTSPNAQVQLGTTTANRKLVLYDVNNDDHQFYGFGVQSGEIRYQTQSTLSNHRFYAGTSSTTSALLMTISGAGNVAIAGSLSKGSGTFKIDHPLDPENKFLYHSFVESPDMMNVYNGNVQTDAEGNVVVTLPEYFEALNKDFRYQLTVIGQFAQAIVMEELKENKFSIKTDKPNVKVSWQVTGIRKDPFAEKNRVVPEVEKAADEKGKYLHPEAYGQPTEKKIGYENHELKQE